MNGTPPDRSTLEILHVFLKMYKLELLSSRFVPLLSTCMHIQIFQG